MIDYGAVMKRCNIEPHGVVHVGAYDGSEDDIYRALGFRRRLFVEADPQTFTLLQQKLTEDALCANYAISDRNGEAKFNRASFSQSSSLLQMEKHLIAYPGISQHESIDVVTIRLDDLLAQSRYSGMTFNFLNVDIQGAEMLCLGGACGVLRQFDLLNLEINFDTLYDGAAHVSQIDAFLYAYDFVRADTVMAHKSWGDAIYLRNHYTKVS